MIRKTKKIFQFINYLTFWKSNKTNFSVRKRLFVFDFDETIIENNSDTYIFNTLEKKDIPQKLKETYRPGFWLDFMRNVFDFMKENNVSPIQMKTILEEIPLTDGFQNLIQYINSKNEDVFESIIISNANTLFIDWILQKKGLTNIFDKIFTNQAKIEEGLIKIYNYHSHDCPFCPVNMCKKKILLDFLHGKKYESICYVGDGLNDFCPTTLLKKKDVVFPREKFPLSEKIRDHRKNHEYEPKVCFWNNGLNILQYIKNEKN